MSNLIGKYAVVRFCETKKVDTIATELIPRLKIPFNVLKKYRVKTGEKEWQDATIQFIAGECE